MQQSSTHRPMHGIFRISNKETQSTLPDLIIYIHYEEFRTTIRELFLVHYWRERDGYSNDWRYACSLPDSCRWFLSPIFSKGSYLFYFPKMYSCLFVYAHHKICQIITYQFFKARPGILKIVKQEKNERTKQFPRWQRQKKSQDNPIPVACRLFELFH